MSTTLGSFEEFWAASGPFFDRLKHSRQTNKSDEEMPTTAVHHDRILFMVEVLAETVVKQAEKIESLERRLERLEGTA